MLGRYEQLARHANAKVTLTVYADLTGDGREKAVSKLTAGGLRSMNLCSAKSAAGVRRSVFVNQQSKRAHICSSVGPRPVESTE